LLLLTLFALAALLVGSACYRQQPAVSNRTAPTEAPTPGAREPAGPSPSRLLANRPRHNAPALNGAGDEARRSVSAFIDWAGQSIDEEHDDARKALEGVRDNQEIVKAFTEEITRAQKTDHSRALLALSLLGEIRSPAGQEFLHQFVNQPFPREGTRTQEGEIIEQTALATLQAKAIDGLAYMHNERADAEVLRQVQEHPSIIVRAEAIQAYLWNQQDKEAARRTLSKYIRKGEERYLDQLTREQGEQADSFNRKLEAYLKAHPEVIPPAPEKGREEAKQDDSPRPPAPPAF
jgi:hypothetical protein